LKRWVAVLSISIAVLCLLCGCLFYQNNNFRNQISVLEGQVTEYQNQTGQLETQISELESQIDECQNQTSEMKNQIDELEQQNLELQNQTLELESLIDKFTNRVKITKFSSAGFNPMVGLLISSSANVTIQNFGINDVENLTLIVTTKGTEDFSITNRVNLICVGETQIISTHYYWYLGSTDGPKVTLMLGETILDEYTPP